MVRLRRSSPVVVNRGSPGFNPTMVRLRLKNLLFHACSGWIVSIPLWCDCDEYAKKDYSGAAQSFNPTMVRLRLSLTLAQNALFCCFNPTMVRLRLLNIRGKMKLAYGFNPTMVRLRPGPTPFPGPRQEAFQSHYGAIATGPKANL